MSTKRHADAADFPERRGPDGERLCRWCGVEVKKPRRNWCSQRCVDDYTLRSSAVAMHRFVFERDKGVCATCGRDTEKIRAQLERRLHAAWESTDRTARLRAVSWSRLLGRLGLSAGMFSLRHLWEADHVVPVVEGGGMCGPENIRTLCTPCHKAETAALAGRRAKERRKTIAQKSGVLFEEPIA